MTDHKAQKRAARAFAKQHGISYTAALRELDAARQVSPECQTYSATGLVPPVRTHDFTMQPVVEPLFGRFVGIDAPSMPDEPNSSERDEQRAAVREFLSERFGSGTVASRGGAFVPGGAGNAGTTSRRFYVLPSMPGVRDALAAQDIVMDDDGYVTSVRGATELDRFHGATYARDALDLHGFDVRLTHPQHDSRGDRLSLGPQPPHSATPDERRRWSVPDTIDYDRLVRRFCRMHPASAFFTPRGVEIDHNGYVTSIDGRSAFDPAEGAAKVRAVLRSGRADMQRASVTVIKQRVHVYVEDAERTEISADVPSDAEQAAAQQYLSEHYGEPVRRTAFHADESFRDAHTGLYQVVAVTEHEPGYRVTTVADTLAEARAYADRLNADRQLTADDVLSIRTSSMRAHYARVGASAAPTPNDAAEVDTLLNLLGEDLSEWNRTVRSFAAVTQPDNTDAGLPADHQRAHLERALGLEEPVNRADVDPLTVACPSCGAGVRERCISSGGSRVRPHVLRYEYAAKLP